MGLSNTILYLYCTSDLVLVVVYIFVWYVNCSMIKCYWTCRYLNLHYIFKLSSWKWQYLWQSDKFSRIMKWHQNRITSHSLTFNKRKLESVNRNDGRSNELLPNWLPRPDPTSLGLNKWEYPCIIIKQTGIKSYYDLLVCFCWHWNRLSSPTRTWYGENGYYPNSV